MINLSYLAEFSRTHCVSICAFLVPANLLATSLTLGLSFTAAGRSSQVPPSPGGERLIQAPERQVLSVALIASLFALTLFLHVGTWLSIGVIMPPSFILSGLGLTCLLANYLAVTNARKFRKLGNRFAQWSSILRPEMAEKGAVTPSDRRMGQA